MHIPGPLKKQCGNVQCSTEVLCVAVSYTPSGHVYTKTYLSLLSGAKVFLGHGRVPPCVLSGCVPSAYMFSFQVGSL